MTTLFRTASAILALLAPVLAGAQDIRTERVRFAPGATGATVEDSITGYETVDYLLGARAGQAMNVSMATRHPAAYFNVIPPGEQDVAIFVGSTSGSQFEGVLPATGDYRIRVYLMRSAARRGETADYRLEMIIGGSGGGSGGQAGGAVPAAPEDGGPRHWEVTRQLNLREEPSTSARVLTSYAPGTVLDNLGCRSAGGRVWCDVQQLGGGPRGFVAAEFLRPAVSPTGAVATGPDNSALRAGQGDFDATGPIPCAQFSGQPMTQCRFGVARAGGGNATVVVTRPDGRPRAIFFSNGIAIGADTSEGDNPGEFRATKEADLHMIRIGPERYEIPDAVVFGG